MRGTAKHSQTLVISWDPPPVDHQNSPITGYTLYYSFHDRQPSKKEISKDDRQVRIGSLSFLFVYFIPRARIVLNFSVYLIGKRFVGKNFRHFFADEIIIDKVFLMHLC